MINTRFRALPCALLLASNCGLKDLLSEHPFRLMDTPTPPPDQVRLTQVGGGEIPVLTTLKTSEKGPIKGMKNNDKPASLTKRKDGSLHLTLEWIFHVHAE